MKKLDNIRVYAWLEFALWILIIAICVCAVRYHHHLKQKEFKSYQIFMSDVDGLIVGSPVRFLGIQIGHVTKIQILSTETNSDLYIKFIITQKDLTLPTGAIATVEGSGLGGSKSLEIYPPNKEFETDKIIETKDSTRLGKVMSLFNDMFKNIDQILTAFTHASNELNSDKHEIPKNIVMPEQADKELIKINNKLDKAIDIDKKFKKHLQDFKKHNKGDENGFIESKSNQ